MFGIRKLASGRTPDMVDYIAMPMNEIVAGRAVTYDAAGDDLSAVATLGKVFGILQSSANTAIEDGGGVVFPLAASSTAAVKPVVMRVYKDTLVEADVTGTIAIANIEPGTALDIDATGDGLVVSTNSDFIVERVLADDGTNVTKVAGYFANTQIGG